MAVDGFVLTYYYSAHTSLLTYQYVSPYIDRLYLHCPPHIRNIDRLLRAVAPPFSPVPVTHVVSAAHCTLHVGCSEMTSPATGGQPSSAASSSHSPFSSASSSSLSPLTPLISSTRSLVSSGVSSVASSEQSAATYWNSAVAQPANRQLQGNTQHNTTRHSVRRLRSCCLHCRLMCCCDVRSVRLSLSVARSDFHRLRDQYSAPAVLTATAVVAALSLPYGRFTALRNAALTALTVGWLVRPSLVTGMMAASTESIVATKPADWTARGEQIVRQPTSSSSGSTQSSNSEQ